MKDIVLNLFTVVITLIFIFVAALAIEFIYNNHFEKILGNTFENFRNLKVDCEKSLPGEDECVLVYDYVPTKGKSK